MSYLYIASPLSYNTTEQQLSPDNISRPTEPSNTLLKHDQGLLPKSCKDEDFGRFLSKTLSPLSFHFHIPGVGHLLSSRILQSSTSPADSVAKKNTTFISIFSISNIRKIMSTGDSDFDDLYDVSSDEEIEGEKNTIRKVKAHERQQNFQSPPELETESPRPVTQTLLKLKDEASHVITESIIKVDPSSETPKCSEVTLQRQTKEIPVFANAQSQNRNSSTDRKQISAQSPQDLESNINSVGEIFSDGVQLEPDAMATLKAISGHHEMCNENLEKYHDLTSKFSVTPEMQQLPPRIFTKFHQSSLGNHSINLDIPSPMRLLSTTFSSGTRHTWHFDSPSSISAENFYQTPSFSCIKNDEPDIPPRTGLNKFAHRSRYETQNLQTICDSQQFPSFKPRTKSFEDLTSHKLNLSHIKNDLIETNFDQTSFWVATQRSTLPDLESPVRDLEDKGTNHDCNIDENNQLEYVEGVYYCAFQYLLSHMSNQDTFIHRIPRYEAIQSQRISFPAMHRIQLLGNYQLSDLPSSAKTQLLSYLENRVEIEADELQKLKRDLEDEAIRQISLAAWTFMAMKFLNGGRLLAAPISEYLSSIVSKMDDSTHDQACILDLGGQEICGWAWHCATEYPEFVVHTVTPKLLELPASRIEGPANHRKIIVESFVKLPFQDNQFDLISARNLYSILKLNTENGIDEWDACLNECFRVLKPGGYIEFEVMDSDITNAGPIGLAKGLEFSTSLKFLGYDAKPTRKWLARLKRSRFVDIRRTWVYLPMGGRTNNQASEKNSKSSTEDRLETDLFENTTDVAPICGLVGSWAWERWLLRCKLQTGGIGEAFEGIGAIIQEGSQCCAGWRSLSGWARKPF